MCCEFAFGGYQFTTIRLKLDVCFCETSDLVGYLAFQDYISFRACVNHGTDLASFKCDVGEICFFFFFFFLLCVCLLLW